MLLTFAMDSEDKIKYAKVLMCIFTLIFGVYTFYTMTRRLYSQTRLFRNSCLPTNRRWLSQRELLYYHQNRLFKHLQLFVTEIISKVELCDTYVERALMSLAKRHPLLRVSIQQDDVTGRPYFKEMDRVTVNYTHNVRPSSHQTEIEKAVAEEGTMLLDIKSGPLWRVSRMKQCYDADNKKITNALLFTFHHAIVDGRSMLYLLDEFLDVIDRQHKGEEIIDSSSAMPDAVELAYPQLVKTTWWENISFMFHLAAVIVYPKILQTRVLQHYLQKYPIKVKSLHSRETVTSAIFMTLTRLETNKLVAACKEQHCTVTGALLAAIHLALVDILERGNSNNYRTDSELSVDLRKHAKTQNQQNVVACYSTPLRIKSATRMQNINNSKMFWDTARNCTASIKLELKDLSLMLKQINVFKSSSFIEKLLGLVGEKQMNLVGLSNLGRYDDLQSKRTFHASTIFCPYTSQMVHCLFFNHVATVNDQLCWDLVYHPELTDSGLAMEFIKKTLYTLKTAFKGKEM